MSTMHRAMHALYSKHSFIKTIVIHNIMLFYNISDIHLYRPNSRSTLSFCRA